MNIKTDRTGVIGSGSWATAIAKMLLENVGQINWFFRKTETIYEINQKHQGYMPICETVYRILYENAPPKKEMANLSRKLR